MRQGSRQARGRIGAPPDQRRSGRETTPGVETAERKKYREEKNIQEKKKRAEEKHLREQTKRDEQYLREEEEISGEQKYPGAKTSGKKNTPGGETSRRKDPREGKNLQDGKISGSKKQPGADTSGSKPASPPLPLASAQATASEGRHTADHPAIRRLGDVVCGDTLRNYHLISFGASVFQSQTEVFISSVFCVS